MSDIAKKDPKQTSWRPNNPKSKEKLMCDGDYRKGLGHKSNVSSTASSKYGCYFFTQEGYFFKS
jgi:hypothetical protein